MVHRDGRVSRRVQRDDRRPARPGFVDRDAPGNTVARFVPHKNFFVAFDPVMQKLARAGIAALVRVVVKCDYVVDGKKRAVDGNFLHASLPSGDGVAGGTFESWFF